MRVILAVIAALFLIFESHAATLFDHFIPGACVARERPTLIVADATRRGEIDDTISLLVYRELEKRGCIKVIAVVSIFGNGGSSTAQVHHNLTVRLGEIGLHGWRSRLLRGPDRKSFGEMTPLDKTRLNKIAERVNSYDDVVIVELGPMTVSARLLMRGMGSPHRVGQILGVGGRLEGERFATGRTWAGSLFGFRDMNVAEDTQAVRDLIQNYPEKIWMVTYRTGLGSRTVDPDMIAELAPALAGHARGRFRVMAGLLGYDGIPSWDTWTSSYFILGGSEALGCKPTGAKLRYDGGAYRDPMQLWLEEVGGRVIVACHRTSVAR